MPECEFKRRVKSGKLRIHNKISGGYTTYHFVEEVGGTTTGCYSACWPMHCDSMGVHPDQAKAAAEYDAKLGVPTDYDTEGNPVFTSQQHYKQHLQAHAYFNRTGGADKLDYREREIRAMAGRAVRTLDD